MQIFFDDLALPHLARTQLGAHRAEEERARRLHQDRRARQPRDRAHADPVAGASDRAGRAASSAKSQALEASFAHARSRPGNRRQAARTLRRDSSASQRRRGALPFIDEPDLRYRNRVVACREPIARAVMFCLMDVSASMDEDKKDLAKRFFTLLYLFLTRKYERGRPGLHPPHRGCRGSRRGRVLPRHAVRRHRRLSALDACRADLRSERYAQRLEHLRRAGLRRRRVRRRPGPQRALPARAGSCRRRATSPTWSWPTPRRQTARRRCGPSTSASPNPPTISRCAARRAASRSTRCSASCSGRSSRRQ